MCVAGEPLVRKLERGNRSSQRAKIPVSEAARFDPPSDLARFVLTATQNRVPVTLGIMVQSGHAMQTVPGQSMSMATGLPWYVSTPCHHVTGMLLRHVAACPCSPLLPRARFVAFYGPYPAHAGDQDPLTTGSALQYLSVLTVATVRVAKCVAGSCTRAVWVGAACCAGETLGAVTAQSGTVL